MLIIQFPYLRVQKCFTFLCCLCKLVLDNSVVQSYNEPYGLIKGCISILIFYFILLCDRCKMYLNFCFYTKFTL